MPRPSNTTAIGCCGRECLQHAQWRVLHHAASCADESCAQLCKALAVCDLVVVGMSNSLGNRTRRIGIRTEVNLTGATTEVPILSVEVICPLQALAHDTARRLAGGLGAADGQRKFTQFRLERAGGGGSILIPTNKRVRDWTELLTGDEVLATSILDRLLHRVRVLKRSYPLCHVHAHHAQHGAEDPFFIGSCEFSCALKPAPIRRTSCGE